MNSVFIIIGYRKFSRVENQGSGDGGSNEGREIGNLSITYKFKLVKHINMYISSSHFFIEINFCYTIKFNSTFFQAKQGLEVCPR